MSGKAPPREPFPGGDVVPGENELRVSITKKAYAEILAHAKEEPDIEICGVLIGKLKDDKHGPYLHVTNTIRGEKAKNEGAQVTFTHETWDHIHNTQDREFPDLDIVGWYHTHPGFDIFLSDMDKFIHNNFFDNPNQVAYVYDPHQGTDGFFRKVGDKIDMMERYWHGGKVRKTVPPEKRIKPMAVDGGGGGGDVTSAIAALNDSVRRLELEVRALQESGGGGGWGMLLVMLLMVCVVGFVFLYGRGGGYSYVEDVGPDGKRVWHPQERIFLEPVKDPRTGETMYRQQFLNDLRAEQMRALKEMQKPAGGDGSPKSGEEPK